VSDDLATASALRLGAGRLSRRLRLERPPGALSTAKLAVLADLHRLGDQTAGRLASAQRVQPQSLTRVLASLEAAGLIARRRNAADGRQARLSITRAGIEELAADMAGRDDWLAAAIARASPGERVLLHAAGELMQRIAED
jgi:DNA-binding MarR family transcriptional regulator